MIHKLSYNSHQFYQAPFLLIGPLTDPQDLVIPKAIPVVENNALRVLVGALYTWQLREFDGDPVVLCMLGFGWEGL